MKVATYIKETKGELKHVNWPGRWQATAFTGVVIAFSLVVSALLGLADLVFNSILRLVF